MRLTVCLLVCAGLLALSMAGLGRAQGVADADIDGKGSTPCSLGIRDPTP